MRNVSAKIADISKALPSGDKDTLMAELKTLIKAKLQENNENIVVIGQMFRENASKHYSLKLK